MYIGIFKLLSFGFTSKFAERGQKREEEEQAASCILLQIFIINKKSLFYLFPSF
jgi:hypothetical protein